MTDCYPIPGPAHPVTHAAHPAHLHAGIPQGVVHHAPIHHLPVYGPPPPTIALNCVRTPGELPAFPGGGAAHPLIQGAQPGLGDLGPGSYGPGSYNPGSYSQGFYGQAQLASAVTPSLGSGVLGLAQAALVAGGLGLAAAGGLAMMAPVSTGPAQTVGPIYAVTPTPDCQLTRRDMDRTQQHADTPFCYREHAARTARRHRGEQVASGELGPGPDSGSATETSDQLALTSQAAPATTTPVTTAPATTTPATTTPITQDTSQPAQTATPATPIPEPGTLALFGAGAFAALAARLYLRRRTAAPTTGSALP